MITTTLENIDYREEIRQKTAKPLLWIGLVSIVMFFSGLTSAVVVSKSSATWLQFDVPFTFTISTIIILISSLTLHWGLLAVKKDNKSVAKLAFQLTLLLALGFVVSQFFAWIELYENGIVFSGGDPAGSYFYAITALHLLHVLGGVISLIVVVVKAMREKYGSENYLGIQLSATYWHFLGALWVYLFFFLRFIA